MPRAKTKQVPIQWNVPGDLVSRYANNVVIQHGADEFIISFFEIMPPILIGTEGEIETSVQSIDNVVANCVGRFILPPSQLERLIGTLQTNLDAYNERFGEPEAEE